MKIYNKTIVTYNSSVLVIACLSPFVIALFFSIGSAVFPFIITVFLSLCICVTLYVVSNYFLKHFFNEYLSIENSTIIYTNSWFNGKKEGQFSIGNIKEILCEHEMFSYVPGSRNSVYLCDHKSNKNPLIINKVRWFLSIDYKLLNDIAYNLKVPIIEKKYILNGNLKKRREA